VAKDPNGDAAPDDPADAAAPAAAPAEPGAPAADAETEPAQADDIHIDIDAGDRGDDGGDVACVYGDNAYGTGGFHDHLQGAGIESRCKTQQPVAAGGLFAKDRFEINLEEDTVTCPVGNTAPIRRGTDGSGVAHFGPPCAGCPLQAQCTTAAAGRTVGVGVYERQLAAARVRQRDPGWIADYRATRPKVERKIGHLMRRHHGGRRARVRGLTKVNADFALLAAAVNLARLAVLAVASTPGRAWTATA